MATKITTTYSHAAPFIRECALRAAYEMATATTIRVRGEKRGQLFAYIRALEILMRSPDGAHQPPEVANLETIPHEWRPAIEQFLEEKTRAELFPKLT